MMVVAATVAATVSVGALLLILTQGLFFSRSMGVPAGLVVVTTALAAMTLTGFHPVAVVLLGIVTLLGALLTIAAHGTERR